MTRRVDKLFLYVPPFLRGKCCWAVATCMALLLFLPVRSAAQDMAVKTNAVGWATVSPNIAFEYRVARKWTLDLSLSYNPFTFGDNKKWRHVAVQPRRVTGCVPLSAGISWAPICCICTTMPVTCTCPSACGNSCATIVFRVTSTAAGWSTAITTSSTSGGASRALSVSVLPIPARSITVVAIADVIREYRRKTFSCLPSSRFRWFT